MRPKGYNSQRPPTVLQLVDGAAKLVRIYQHEADVKTWRAIHYEDNNDVIPFDPPYTKPVDKVKTEGKKFYPLKPIGEAKSVWEADWDWVRAINAKYAAEHASKNRPPLVPKDFPYSYAAKAKEPLSRKEDKAPTTVSTAHLERMRMDAVRYHAWLRKYDVFNPKDKIPLSEHPLWDRLQCIRSHHQLNARVIPEGSADFKPQEEKDWKRYQKWLRKYSTVTKGYNDTVSIRNLATKLEFITKKSSLKKYKRAMLFLNSPSLRYLVEGFCEWSGRYDLDRITTEQFCDYLELQTTLYKGTIVPFNTPRWFVAKHTRRPKLSKLVFFKKALNSIIDGVKGEAGFPVKKKPFRLSIHDNQVISFIRSYIRGDKTEHAVLQEESSRKFFDKTVERLKLKPLASDDEIIMALDTTTPPPETLIASQGDNEHTYEAKIDESQPKVHVLALKKVWGSLYSALIPEGYRLKDVETPPDNVVKLRKSA
jgi:hypothetical protein